MGNTALELVIGGAVLAATYCLLAGGLTLCFGVLGVVDFAHGDLLMVGMYVSWAMSSKLGANSLFGAFLAIPISIAIGLLAYFLVIRPAMHVPGDTGLTSLFATVGMSAVLEGIATVVFGTNTQSVLTPSVGGATSFNVLSVRVSILDVIVVAAAIVIFCGLKLWLSKTFTGRMVRATSEDREVARMLGVPVNRVFMLAFTLSVVTVAIAGAIVLPLYSVSPYVGQQFVFIAFLIVVIGGLGSLGGAVVGAVLLATIGTLCNYFLSPVDGYLIEFCLFIVVLLVRPQGIMGKAAKAA